MLKSIGKGRVIYLPNKEFSSNAAKDGTQFLQSHFACRKSHRFLWSIPRKASVFLCTAKTTTLVLL
jgi:hypothetical protein